MPNNSNVLQHRFLEVAAVENARTVVTILTDAVTKPPTKTFQRQREERLTRWRQLAETAQAMIGLLGQPLPAARRAKAKVTVCASAPTPSPTAAETPA